MSIKTQAERILKDVYGQEACFRDGQLEAIKATLTNKRTLVVQKTGWGKSIIYFIATKIIRQNGGGTTLIISPLLELMNNQIEVASLFHLNCETLNSTIKNADERSRILRELQDETVDVFFTTPETLFHSEVQAIISDINFSLFVIDEVHCLSEWGHDFRLDYSRLYKIIEMLPSSAPVLCTTATANQRVIDNLSTQLGAGIFISKGDLMRESLCLQVVHLQKKAERYAWILDHINDFPGTGIIYCLTKRDCDHLNSFLKQNGISVAAYYSDDNRENAGFNTDAISKFKHNKIKAIIATIKLGMGYDKPDVGFIIHYQRPQNIVSYYQQIGRAGRNIAEAYVVLMTGLEDEEILNSFIENAFPDEDLCNKVLNAANGESKWKIQAVIYGGKRKNRIGKAIDFLEFHGYLRKDGSKYYRVPKKFQYNREKYNAITAVRRQEMEQMSTLIETDECLLRYIVNCLDNPYGPDCGRCENCIGSPLIPKSYSAASLQRAQEFFDLLVFEIKPRLRWVGAKRTKIPYPLQPGICLSKYGDIGYGGYGEMVKDDKYKADEFRDELLVKAVKVLQEVVKKNDVRFLTFVPSLRNDKVKKFAEKLATALKLDFFEVIQKSEAPPQKNLKSSAHQCQNALASFSIQSDFFIHGNAILVDDIVDSRWTLTVCGNLLGEHGCERVIPFCLADSSDGG